VAEIGEPIANSGGLLVWMLAEEVRHSHKVVLTGQGADEPLGGYPRHVVERIRPYASFLSGPAVRVVRAVKGRDDAARLARALAAPTKIDRYVDILSVVPPEQVDLVVRSASPSARELARDAVGRWTSGEDSGDGLNDFLRVDLRMSLADDLLLIADHFSMRASVELRVPFLDLRFLELVERMPSRYKVSTLGSRKWLYRRAAAASGADGCWLAVGLGVVLTVVGLALAPQIADVMGASTNIAPFAVTYLRISILGAPALLLALAGAGYLRGMQDTSTTLVIAVTANVLNLLLELLLVYGLDQGIAGSAWGTVIAQYGSALAYVVIVARAVRREGASVRPRPEGIRANARVGSRLVVRTASLIVALLTATAIASRISDDAVAAHQICMQVLLALALALDALAIAGQAMVGRFLGAASVHDARAVGRRLIELGIGVGVVFGLAVVVARPWLAGVFTADAGVRHLTLEVLWIVAALQPVAAVVFVLDGVLIGAGDAGYLALAMLVATVGVYLPAALLVAALDGGLLWLWGALALWMLGRFVGMVARFRTTRWEIAGASPTP